jgi:transmembrane sensor
MRDAIDDAAIARMWRGVGQRRVAKRARARRSAWALAAAGLVTAIVVLVVRPRDPGPILLSGGAPIAQLNAPADGQTFALSDGSRVELARGASFSAHENSSSRFSGALRGYATFDVHPGGPRRWTIDCGLATVEVVGTRFEIDARAIGSTCASSTAVCAL